MIENLAAACPDVHTSIGKIWTAFRAAGVRASPESVNMVMKLVDQSYGRWYNVVFVSTAEKATLQAAERRALLQLQELLQSL